MFNVESALPYVIIQTGSENSVSCTGGEISAGDAQSVAVQLGDGLAFGLLQTPAVVNFHSPASRTKHVYDANKTTKRNMIKRIFRKSL